MKKIILLICAISIILMGCYNIKINDSNNIGVRGQIKRVTLDRDGNVIEIYVEGENSADIEYDSAVINIDKNTKITNLNKEKLMSKDLKINYIVEVIFSGSVKESYPVQGDAKKISIIQSQI